MYDIEIECELYAQCKINTFIFQNKLFQHSRGCTTFNAESEWFINFYDDR